MSAEFCEGLIFHGENIHGECPEPPAGVQVSTYISCDLHHPG